MLMTRREYPAFGLGTFEDLGGSNPSVFAFAREYEDQVIVCVNNLSRFAQYTELDLSRYDGHQPVELLGGVALPPVGSLPYLLTLAPHGFYWFRLTR
jgi:maltose alpha-D-glucosyltransferase/alpha-amylase